MPMPKGTKPNARTWKEVTWGELRTALSNFAKDTKKSVREEVKFGKRFFWHDDRGIIAKRTIHKRSEQCLILVNLQGYLPKPREEEEVAA